VKIASGAQLGAANLPDLADDAPSGYEFLGWSLVATNRTALLDGSETFDDDTILYAQWITNLEIKVYFNLNYRNSGAPTLVIYNRGTSLGATHDPAPTLRTGYTFNGWWTDSRATGTKYLAATNVPAQASLSLYADWEVVDTVAADKVVSKSAIQGDTTEWVIVDNRFYAVYEFKLPEGARWADYESLTAEYLVDKIYWEIPNSAAGSRLMGNFKRSDFVPFTTNAPASKKLAVSDYGARNATHIMDTGAGDWKTVKDCAKYNNATLVEGEYFTFTYQIDAQHAHGSFSTANQPDPMAKGPFYFGLGLGSQGATPYGTIQKIKNVKLKASAASGKADVYATPLYLNLEESEGVTAADYPAYTGYSNKNGSASENLAYRSTTDAPSVPPPETPLSPATADFTFTLPEGGKTNSTAFTGAYGSSNDLVFKVEFPDGINASSYAKYEILATFYSDDDATVEITTADGLGQIVWTADVSDWYGARTGTTYNLDNKTGNPNPVDIPAALKYYPSMFDGFAIQNSSATVKFIKITSIKFYKP